MPDGYWEAADNAHVAGWRLLTHWPDHNLPSERYALNN